MKIKKQDFLEIIKNMKTNGYFPTSLEKFANTYSKRNGYKVENFIRELEEHVHTLDDEIPISEIFPPLTNDNVPYWGFLLAFTTCLIKDIDIKRASPKNISSDLVVDKVTLIEGDLTLEGNLSTPYIDEKSINLIVLGDLTINGNYTFEDGRLIVFGDLIINGAFDEESDYSVTVIGGTVFAQDFINSSGDFFAMGKIISPLIHFSYNHGHCGLNEGFKSLLFVESDHGGSFSLGENEAQFILYDEIRGVTMKNEIQDYKNLQRLFIPDKENQIVNVDFDDFDYEEYEDDVSSWLEEKYDLTLIYFIDEELLSRLRKGKSLFKKEVVEEFFNSIAQ